LVWFYLRGKLFIKSCPRALFKNFYAFLSAVSVGQAFLAHDIKVVILNAVKNLNRLLCHCEEREARRGNLYLQRRVSLFIEIASSLISFAPRNRLVAKLTGERNCDGFLRQTKIKIDDCSNATIKIFIKVCQKDAQGCRKLISQQV
jgi:hypothetical protein